MTVAEKTAALLPRVKWVSLDSGDVALVPASDGGVHLVQHRGGVWSCDCKYMQRQERLVCCHITAASAARGDLAMSDAPRAYHSNGYVADCTACGHTLQPGIGRFVGPHLQLQCYDTQACARRWSERTGIEGTYA